MSMGGFDALSSTEKKKPNSINTYEIQQYIKLLKPDYILPVVILKIIWDRLLLIQGFNQSEIKCSPLLIVFPVVYFRWIFLATPLIL